MVHNKKEITERQIDNMCASIPFQDLRPEAAARVEAACLAQLRCNRKPPAEWQLSLLHTLEAIFASLLVGSYLLWSLGQALMIYGIHLP
jgi:hypothetical protein